MNYSNQQMCEERCTYELNNRFQRIQDYKDTQHDHQNNAHKCRVKYTNWDTAILVQAFDQTLKKKEKFYFTNNNVTKILSQTKRIEIIQFIIKNKNSYETTFAKKMQH